MRQELMHPRTAGCAAVVFVAMMGFADGAQAAPGDQPYTVTLRAFTAGDAPDAIAADLAALHGGTVIEVAEGHVTLQLSPARARVVAVDPRVETIEPTADATRGGVAATAETMTWRTGVIYQYDGSGNIRQIGSDSFVYAAVGRLVQSDANGIRRNYEYDAYGNRTKCRQSVGTANEGDCQMGLTINPANNRIREATYDDAGNVTALGGHTYTYDALNMQARDQWGTLAREYIYTADDERIAVYDVGTGTWRWTVRDVSGKVLREFTSHDGVNGLGTANWQWTKDYIWRDGLLLASRQIEPGASAPTTYHYHLDHLGTPRRITDSSDRIVGVHDYHAFGPEVSGGQNEPSLSLMKFTGHERDLWNSESTDTLDYMHARYAIGTLGRFLSVDPIYSSNPRVPQSWNKYSYARNNPLKFVDPSGMYVTNCMAGDEACAREAAAFEAARQKELESTNEELRNAAAAYGDSDVENGVNVSFVKQLVDPKTHKPLNADGAVTAEFVGGESAAARYSVQVKSGLNAINLGNVVVHEGTHVLNAQAFVSQLQQGIVGSSMTVYQTEMNAYTVSALYAQSENVRLKYNGMVIVPTMAKEQLRQEIDRFLKKSGIGPTVRRCQFPAFCE